MPAQRWAALVISVVAGACVTLASCSSSSTSSGGPPVSLPSGAVTVPSGPAGGSSGGFGTLTGNFCTDVRSISNIHPPAGATANSTAAKRYLNQAKTYFGGLAAEAPKQVAGSLHSIAAYLQVLAATISSGNNDSLSKVSKKLQSFTTNGTTGSAFRNLIDYMLRDCP